MKEAGEEEDVQGRPGKNIPGRCESEWLVIAVGGKVSLPNAPAGVGRPKSKYR